jgi:tRNA(Ile2) C34 agmatinyltransferase TiaS
VEKHGVVTKEPSPEVEAVAPRSLRGSTNVAEPLLCPRCNGQLLSPTPECSSLRCVTCGTAPFER